MIFKLECRDINRKLYPQQKTCIFIRAGLNDQIVG